MYASCVIHSLCGSATYVFKYLSVVVAFTWCLRNPQGMCLYIANLQKTMAAAASTLRVS